MILSGRDIELYIKTGKLTIDPWTPEQFQQNGVDLVLEDLARGSNLDFRPVDFIRGEFYLGATREVICMPDDLMAFVELRSTWARKGLILPPTIVDAGFTGNLTLEIAAFASVPVPYGQRFVHLIFARTSGPCISYAGKYKDQRGITLAIEDKA